MKIDIIKKIGIPKLILIGVLGILLISLEFGGDSNKEEDENNKNVTVSDDYYDADEYCESLEKKIKSVIEKIEGVSGVEVCVTLKNSSNKVVLTETPYKINSDGTSSDGSKNIISEEKNYNTVYEEDKQGKKVPYVVTYNYPDVKGVAVGITSTLTIDVKEKIINVVSTLTGVTVNNISVIGK